MVKKTKIIYKTCKLTVDDIERAIINFYNLPDDACIQFCFGEDLSFWSGQPWDDGPLPTILTGATITTKEEEDICETEKRVRRKRK
jgi:hypothetical protein